MALVEAPDGIGYILKPGDALGDVASGITPTSARSQYRPETRASRPAAAAKG
jgi:hypothetical protein